MNTYILKDKIPVLCSHINTWDTWMETSNRIVAQTTISKIRISTVFLGLDHNYTHIGEPLLFETMIFGDKYDELQWRYSTWTAAEAGHTKAVKLVKDNG